MTFISYPGATCNARDYYCITFPRADLVIQRDFIMASHEDQGKSALSHDSFDHGPLIIPGIEPSLQEDKTGARMLTWTGNSATETLLFSKASEKNAK